jgi:putative DNA primase/helicase
VNYTDTGNAKRLVRSHGEDLRYCHPWRKWLVFDGRTWRVDDSGEVMRRAKEVVADMYRHAAARLNELTPKDGAVESDGEAQLRQSEIARLKKLVSWALKSEAAPRLAAMVELAKSEPGIPVLPGDLDRDPMLLNCGNGTLDLRTGELRDHCRDDLITKLTLTHFRSDAPCPTWEKFLASVFPATSDAAEEPADVELIRYVQRLLGYCVTGDVREQVLPILWGAGANGKRTLLNAIQGVLGPDYTMKAPRNSSWSARGRRTPPRGPTCSADAWCWRSRRRPGPASTRRW